MTTAIHRTARHALHGDPWQAEKAAQAVEVERRLDAAQKAGKRQAVRLQANREARRAA